MAAKASPNPFGELTANLTMEALQCREDGHIWKGVGANDGYDAQTNGRGRVVSIIRRCRCERCSMEREFEKEVDQHGYAIHTIRRHYRPPDGFRLPPRADGEDRPERFTRGHAGYALARRMFPNLRWP